MRLYKKIIIIVFFLCLIIPMLFMNRKENQVSAIDNRNLQELPSDFKTREKRAEMETYLDDRIGFREKMINANMLINNALFHEMVHPTYTYGKDDYVFMAFADDSKADMGYLEVYTDMIKTIQDYCTNRGIPFRFMLNPAKTRIDSEYLPEGVHLSFDHQNEAIKMLEEKGIPLTWTEDVLRKEKQQSPVYNKQYDAGHWNDLGAIVGLEKLIGDLKSDGVNIADIDRNNLISKKEHVDSLLVSNFPIDEDIEVFSYKKPKAIKEATQVKEPNFVSYVNEEEKDRDSLVVFRGSYLIGREWMLADTCSSIEYVYSYEGYKDFDKYIEKYQPDAVVFECAEYVIADYMYDYEEMKDMIAKYKD